MIINRFRAYFIGFGILFLAALITTERLCCRIPYLSILFWPVMAFFDLFTIRLDQLAYFIPAVYIISFLYALLMLYVMSIIVEYLMNKVRK